MLFAFRQLTLFVFVLFCLRRFLDGYFIFSVRENLSFTGNLESSLWNCHKNGLELHENFFSEIFKSFGAFVLYDKQYLYSMMSNYFQVLEMLGASSSGTNTIGDDVNPDLLQEVRLYENSVERERVDNMSELYAVLNALECLEKVFSRDCIAAKEYTAECSKLLVQYKVSWTQEIKT